jgi:hypothetical protein
MPLRAHVDQVSDRDFCIKSPPPSTPPIRSWGLSARSDRKSSYTTARVDSRLCPNFHAATKRGSVCRFSNRQVKSVRFNLHYRKQSWVGEAKMERSLITDMPRDKCVERCKQRAFDYLDRGDLRSAVDSFANNMNARPDCELPHYLATLGALLLVPRHSDYDWLILSQSRMGRSFGATRTWILRATPG